MNHAQRAILIDVRLFADDKSSMNDDENEHTEQQQEESNKDYDAHEILANAIGC